MIWGHRDETIRKEEGRSGGIPETSALRMKYSRWKEGGDGAKDKDEGACYNTLTAKGEPH